MSNAQLQAAFSHGFIVETVVGDFPSPYDVRFGVDRGDGELGTLTLPVIGDVRRGIEYGGGGIQYIGTMFIPSGGASWTDEMTELCGDMFKDSEYRAALVFNGQTVYGAKMALSLRFTMQISGYQRTADTSFDLFRSDCVSIGLYTLASARNPATTRPTVTVNGQAFMVLDCKDDNATDPTVKLILSALQ